MGIRSILWIVEQIMRFRNDPCVGTNILNGTCYTQRECHLLGGSPTGFCAKGLGVCCVFIKTCGSKSKVNNTYFTNPLYPLQYPGTINRCDIYISKSNKHICQLRLDFLDFSLAQPDADGNCQADSLRVYGSDGIPPRVCGENSNQHVYMNFPPEDSPIELSVDTDVSLLINRKWNIKVTQIRCDSATKAPVGCLMFYTSQADRVMSFNYGNTLNPNIDQTTGIQGTRELSNMNYGICVQAMSGFCSIQWKQVTTNSFTLSGDSGGVDQGTSIAAVVGENCTTDFIVIPNPVQSGVLLQTDRFCGNALLPTTTSSKPFVLTVVTDSNEHLNTTLTDVENRGFYLDYMQIRCTP